MDGTWSMPEDDLNALGLMILSVLRDTPEFGATAHLAYTLNRVDFNRIIDVFGGQMLRIPTRDEVNQAFKAILYYHNRFIQGNRVAEAMRKSHLTPNELAEIQPHLDRIDYIMSHFSGENENAYRSI